MCEKESEGECQPWSIMCHTLVQHKLFIFLLEHFYMSYLSVICILIFFRVNSSVASDLLQGSFSGLVAALSD